LFDQVPHPAGHFPAAAPCRAGNRVTVLGRSGHSRWRDTGHEGGRGLSALILLDTGQPFLQLKLIGGDPLINQRFDTLTKIKQFFQSELIELTKSRFHWLISCFAATVCESYSVILAGA
jgi:hypothetical protein